MNIKKDYFTEITEIKQKLYNIDLGQFITLVILMLISFTLLSTCTTVYEMNRRDQNRYEIEKRMESQQIKTNGHLDRIEMYLKQSYEES